VAHGESFFERQGCSAQPRNRTSEFANASDAMWWLLQGLIFCAVVGSNIHWQWTPNQYLASGIDAGLAWIATQIVVQWRDRRGG
jgi:hypothetical protein